MKAYKEEYSKMLLSQGFKEECLAPLALFRIKNEICIYVEFNRKVSVSIHDKEVFVAEGSTSTLEGALSLFLNEKEEIVNQISELIIELEKLQVSL